jgi:hypothetical protein
LLLGHAAEIAELQELYTIPFGYAYSLLFSLLVVPAWPLLTTIQTFMADVAAVVESPAELRDLKVPGLLSQHSSVQNAQCKLSALIPPALQSLTETVAALTTLGPWIEEQASGLPGAPAQTDPTGCRAYEFLRWHGSSKFAGALMSHAKTDNQKAFALGWMTHVAALVTAEPFVNNIVGGPYRTHWWRNRLAQNFVDAWIYGFAETPGATMAGDEPSPAYESWDALCAANLQQEFDVGNLAGAPPRVGCPPR